MAASVVDALHKIAKDCEHTGTNEHDALVLNELGHKVSTSVHCYRPGSPTCFSRYRFEPTEQIELVQEQDHGVQRRRQADEDAFDARPPLTLWRSRWKSAFQLSNYKFTIHNSHSLARIVT
jgi:hypothetical protein